MRFFSSITGAVKVKFVTESDCARDAYGADQFFQIFFNGPGPKIWLAHKLIILVQICTGWPQFLPRARKWRLKVAREIPSKRAARL